MTDVQETKHSEENVIEISAKVLRDIAEKKDSYTDNQKFYAYKFVSENFDAPYYEIYKNLGRLKDLNTIEAYNYRPLKYALQTHVICEHANTDKDQECADGIHVCSLNGAKQFKIDFQHSPYNFGTVKPTPEMVEAQESLCYRGKIIKVSFRKKHIAAIPERSYLPNIWYGECMTNKIRLHQCFVEEVIQESNQEEIKVA